MKPAVAIAAAWLAATFVAVVIASAAVGNVRTQVTDGPTALGPPTTIEAVAVSSTTVHVDEAPHVNLDVDIDPPHEPPEPEPTSTTTTVFTETTTTVAHTDHPVVTSTTQPPPQHTTTTTTTAGYTKTYNITEDGLTAGTVRISISGESVSFSGATVAPGWTFKLEEEGPEKVQVKFQAIEDDDIELKFKAEFDDGELKIKISVDD